MPYPPGEGDLLGFFANISDESLLSFGSGKLA